MPVSAYGVGTVLSRRARYGQHAGRRLYPGAGLHRQGTLSAHSRTQSFDNTSYKCREWDDAPTLIPFQTCRTLLKGNTCVLGGDWIVQRLLKHGEFAV